MGGKLAINSTFTGSIVLRVAPLGDNPPTPASAAIRARRALAHLRPATDLRGVFSPQRPCIPAFDRHPHSAILVRSVQVNTGTRLPFLFT